MRESSYAQFEPDGAIMSVETLAGKELAWHIRELNDGVRDMSPSERLFVTQIGLEPVLRARAEELGAELRFGTELVDCEQDADGVTAVIRDRATARRRRCGRATSSPLTGRAARSVSGSASEWAAAVCSPRRSRSTSAPRSSRSCAGVT